MRTLCWWSIVGAATLALMGCSSTSPTVPTGQSNSDGYSTYAENGASVVNNAGHFRMRIDLNTLKGTVVPVGVRESQLIGDLYHLNINQFFGGSAFQLRTIGLTPSGDVTVDYAVSHPFNAPTNLGGPATAANRIDLGVSGRVLFMTPAPAGRVDDETSPLNKDDYEFVFGGSTTIANTKVVKNANGYYNPAGMITIGGFPAQNDANAWPFRELVDEGLNSREATNTGAAIDNGSSSTGNYNAATGGWQNGNIGANNNGWTGYGVLHQGQTATNTVVFDPDEAAGGIFELDVVVIAKYTDPRGGSTPTQKRANRLPTSDPNNFAYRMPWGAIDIAQVAANEDAPLGAAAASTANLLIGVVDLDMTATEDAGFPTAGANLDQIPTGTGGVSTITVSSGDLGMSDVAATSAGTGTGTHADDADYTAVITNNPGTAGGVDGGAYVMVNVVDPEDAFVATAPLVVLSLNENSPPGPLTADFPRVQVFQADFVDIN